MLPAFLGKNHPLHRYSDANFHRWCFAACPDREALEAAFTRYEKVWKDRPKDLKTLEEINAWGKSAFAEFK